MTALVELRAITKSFGGVRALKGVDFAVEPGEVHALVGENGAGKSTLMRVIGGEFAPDSGEVRIDGAVVQLKNPKAALDRGIALIHQELALAPDLTVAENIFMRELPGVISWPKLNRRARDLIRRLGFDISPSQRTSDLPVALQQVVEIAKALSRDIRMIVFDEPTAVLAASDAERLHKIIAGLRQSGVGIVYISHRLDEVLRIADRVTVMKDGASVGVVLPAEADVDALIRMMVGRQLNDLLTRAGTHDTGREVLRVAGLHSGRRVRDVSLTINAGEIVGLGGMVGSGRTEVARVIFGADRRDAGDIHLGGKRLKLRSPHDAVKAGIGLVPEDRKMQGVIPSLSIRVNTTMARLGAVVNAAGFIRAGAEQKLVAALSQALRLKFASLDAPVANLSGGNQQKVSLAKWFHAGGDVIILDEPTRGVDVGAKSEIYGLVEKLAAEGKAVLVISSEHQELFKLCDRILVMNAGEVRGELTPEAYSEANLLSLAMKQSAMAPEMEA